MVGLDTFHIAEGRQAMLQLSFLGEQRVNLQGADDSPSLVVGRALEVLACLVVNADRPQERERLAGLLWPQSADGQARTNLRRELHGLKQLSGLGDHIHQDGTALVWHDGPGCSSDLRDFHGHRTLALHCQHEGDSAGLLAHGWSAIISYGGELLPGLYAEWVLAERETLQRQCVELCDKVAAAAAAGMPERALDAAQRRIQLAPLEETGYQTLMELQFAAGDAAAAVRSYHRCSAILEQELGVEPGPRTRELARGLLGFTPAPRPAGGRAVMNLVQGTRANRPVGRDRQESVLQKRWDRACAGVPGLVLVTGDAGVGKTRLLTALLATAHAQGATTAYARCFAGAGSIALAPVVDWLDSPALRPFSGGRRAFWGAELARLVPERRTNGQSPPRTPKPWPGTVLANAWRRRSFHESMARAVLATGQPTLMVLDDLQWCDEETLDWLAVLFSLAPTAQLLIAAAARPEELGANAATVEAVDALRTGHWVQELALAPLDAADTAELAASVLDRALSNGESELLHAATGGYPLHVVETARGMGGATLAEVLAGTPDGDGVLRRRFEQCSPQARAAASLAAAIGREFSLETLALAWPDDEQSLVRAIDELWRRRILRELHGGYDFTHDLLRKCAYELVSPPRRWLLHRSLARALEAQHPGDGGVVAAQLAVQYRSAGDSDRAVGYFIQAGDAATGIFANLRAVADYQAALDLIAERTPDMAGPGRELEVLVRMPQPLTALRGYSSPQLRATLERIIDLAEATGRSQVLASALIGLFACTFVQGETARSHTLACRALDLAQAIPDLVGQANFAVAGAATSLGRIEEAIAHFDLACAQATDAQSYILGTRIDVHARSWASHAHWLAGDDGGALALADEAVDRATLAEHPYSLAVAMAYRAVLWQMRMAPRNGAGVTGTHPGTDEAQLTGGDLDCLAREAAGLEALCSRYNFAYYGHWGSILRGWAAGGGQGADTIRAGMAKLRATLAFARMPYWQCLLAETLVGCGRHHDAVAVLAAAESSAQQRDDLWWLPEILRQRALLEAPPAGRSLLARARLLAEAQHSPMLAARVADTATSLL